jgi:hypothetical protein
MSATRKWIYTVLLVSMFVIIWFVRFDLVSIPLILIGRDKNLWREEHERNRKGWAKLAIGGNIFAVVIGLAMPGDLETKMLLALRNIMAFGILYVLVVVHYPFGPDSAKREASGHAQC